MAKIQIGKRVVEEGGQPYVIAEIGVNHEGVLSLARELIALAKEGGADAAKFQTYKAETLAAQESPSYWDLSAEPTRSQRELFKKYDKFEERDYRELAEHCSKIGIDFLSTPFDDPSLEFLKDLMPVFKIASADLTNTPFLRKIAKYRKPIILSTGASNLAEIDHALLVLYKAGASEIALLHCILNYPTQNENAHLAMIGGLKRAYPELVIGYSDHVPPDREMTALTTAYLKGAVLLEKHFTHDKTLPGNDHYHAMDILDLKNFRQRIEHIRDLLGPSLHKHAIPTEEISRLNARRSIVLQCPIPKGTVLTESLLTYKRPGTGISPMHWDEVIGKKTVKDLEADHILQWQDLV